MTTINFTLTESWQLVLTGAGLITLETGDRAEYHIASATPAVGADYQSILRQDGRSWLEYTKSEKVYMRKTDPTGENTVIIGVS